MMTATLFLLTAALQLQAADVHQRGMDPERLALIPTRLQEYVEQGKIAGAVMVLARHDGIVLLEAVGYQDLETQTPMRPDAIFWMASVAKPMTALGIMVLQEEGRLSVWDPVGRHLPDLGNLQTEQATEPPPPITIEQLMTHTAGMAPSAQDGGAINLYPRDFMRTSLADVVATFASRPLAYAPGTSLIYASQGFDILGRVIEVVSGNSYEAFMEERVFGPLGMEDSGFFSAMWERLDRIPPSYRIEDDQLREFTYVGNPIPTTAEEGIFPSPGFGLFSTAPDLGALLQMMLSDGTYDGRRILSRASVTAMTVDQVRDDEIGAHGWGWSVGDQLGGPLASSRAYGHGGGTGVSVWVDPENDLAGAFLIHQRGEEALFAVDAFMAMAAAAVVDR